MASSRLYVRESNAAKTIKATVILKGTREVATIYASYGQSRVLVNVFQDSKAQQACAKATGVENDAFFERVAHDRFGFQHSSAGGYGYDKYAAALSDLWIDGHKMSNHSADRLKKPKGLDYYPDGFKCPKGYAMANRHERRVHNDDGTWSTVGEPGWADCYRKTGTDYLRDIGYTVIQVL